MSRFIKSAAILAVLLAGAPSALALKPLVETYAVSYADLDLSQPAGVKTLMRRLNAAANQVCGGGAPSTNIRAMMAYQTCRAETLGNAVRKVDQPAVTQAWLTSSGGRSPQLASR